MSRTMIVCPNCGIDLTDEAYTAWAVASGKALKKQKPADYYQKLGTMAVNKRWENARKKKEAELNAPPPIVPESIF